MNLGLGRTGTPMPLVRMLRRYFGLPMALTLIVGLTILATAASPHIHRVRATPSAYNYAQGYSLVGSDGGLFNYGTELYNGSMGGQHLNAPVVGVATFPGTDGYWEVGADGGIYAFGNAAFYGSMGGQTLNAPVVGMAVMPHGGGYWEVGADGGIFAFNTAGFYGSMGGQHLNAPIVGMASTSDGHGYWLVGADGGIYAFGDAGFYGSEGGVSLPSPIVGIAENPGGTGYWMVSQGGGVYAFGDAQYYGGLGSTALQKAIVGITPSQDGGGYWLAASDGGVAAYGDAQYLGGVVPGTTLGGPIVGVAAVSTNNYGRNLLTNGGFENGGSGWSLYGTSNFVVYGSGGVSGENPYQGNYFAAMNSTNNGGILQQFNMPIAVNQTFCVSADLASQGFSSTARGALAIFLLGGTTTEGSNVPYGPLPGGSDWQSYQTCATATVAHTEIGVQFYLAAGTTTADNIMLTSNMLMNGGFNNAMTGWQVLPGTGYATYGSGQVTGENPYEGTGFMATNTSGGGGVYQSEGAGINVGETYCLTAELSSQGTSSNATGSLSLSLVSGSTQDSSSIPYGPLPGSSTWTLFQTCVTATAQRQAFKVLISPGAGTTTVDDVNVT